MNEFAARIERSFPMRRREKEKLDFRTWLVFTLKELGYTPRLVSGRDSLSFGGSTTNVVVGDIEKAKLVLAAHYDTGVRDLLPPFLCPTRPVTFLLYQAVTPFLALVGSFLIALAVSFPLNLPNLMLPLFLFLLAVVLFYPKYGPSEKNSRNANTSGVVTLLEVAKSLTPRYRGEVALVFLDGGTQAAKGAKELRRAYPCLKEKTVIVVDCVGEGDELLVLPNKSCRWDGALLDAINDHFKNSEKKTCFLKTDGFVSYPSDNRAFSHSTTICACKKVAGFGRCILPRGTEEIDGENISLLCESLCELIAYYHPQKA